MQDVATRVANRTVSSDSDLSCLDLRNMPASRGRCIHICIGDHDRADGVAVLTL